MQQFDFYLQLIFNRKFRYTNCKSWCHYDKFSTLQCTSRCSYFLCHSRVSTWTCHDNIKKKINKNSSVYNWILLNCLLFINRWRQVLVHFFSYSRRCTCKITSLTIWKCWTFIKNFKNLLQHVQLNSNFLNNFHFFRAFSGMDGRPKIYTFQCERLPS